ncbi:MAG: acyltransferase [Clostridiaceae bacterium]|nr:acyltransferase [Clostridiaceae bacterium]
MKRLKLPLTAFLLAILATTLVYLMTEMRHGLFSRPFNAKNYCIIAALISCSLFIHYKRCLSTPSYRKMLTGTAVSPGRIVYMDWLRVLAALFVICVHVMESAYEQLTPHTFSWEILAILASLCLSCNLLFMMLSGALILNGKDEPVLVFYKKRLSKVLIPCFAYYLFYRFYASGFSVFYPQNWKNLIQSFLSNSSGLTPHFWLVFVILMFYVTAPFFKIMMKHMSDQMLGALVAVIFCLHFFFTYAPYLNLGFAASTFLASWESIFILGYFCTRKTSSRYYRLISGLGMLSVLVFIITVHTFDDYSAVLYNNAPPMMFLSCSIFMFFKKHGSSWFSKIPAFLSMISKYSFSILLIHWLILFEVVDKQLGINGLSFGIAGGTPLTILLTLLISLAFSIFYDNTVVLCMDATFQFLCALPSRFKTASK